jgi:NADH pyrophosphatase NudC (nudix superfamily)
MGKTHKCIRQILAGKLKTTKLSTKTREAGFVEAGEEIVEAVVAEEDTEVHIKEGIKEGKPMTIQILALL